MSVNSADRQRSDTMAAGMEAGEEPAFRYRNNLYFQDGQWLTALLAGVLYLILATALDAAGHVDSLAVLAPITLGAFLLGLLMSYSRFDGFFALSHSMFTGLAWILFIMSSLVTVEQITPFVDNGIPELQARVYFVLLRLLDWVDAALSGGASADNFVFVFEISFLMWWLTYLGVWAIFRHGYTWRAIIPAGVVLLVNTYYAPRSTIGFLAVFMFVALVLLVRTNLSEQQLRWRIKRVYFNQDIVWDFLRNGLMFSIVIVVLAWVLPGLGRNPRVQEALAPVSANWESTAQNMQRLYQGLNRQPTVGSNFGDHLTLGGQRKVGDSPVFSVAARSGRYWRAVAYDTYDGRGWRSTADSAVNYSAGQIVPVASWRAREAISQTVTILGPVGDVLFGAPEIAEADLSVKAQVRTQAGADPIPAANPDAGARPVEFAIVRANRDLNHGDRYALISAVTNASERDLRSASSEIPPAILDRFVQLPPNFSPRVAGLAREITASAATSYDKAKAIEAYLRQIPYNEAILAPPADVDPLEYFLFDVRQGYCDYYASAMAMMLRSLGIPARAVSGYAEGIYDEQSGTYFVTERDAHTWVEVFFPEYGWIEFEPTASKSPLQRPTGDEQGQTAITSQKDEQKPQPPKPAATPVDDLSPRKPPPFTGEDLVPPARAAGPQPPWWILLAALLLLIPLGVFLVWKARHDGPTAFTAELPAVLYDRMVHWTQRLGLGPRPQDTPYEHAAAVGAALPAAQPQVQELTGEYVRFRFGRPSSTRPPAGEADRTLVAAWRVLESLFWKAWLRSRRQQLFHRSLDPYRLLDEDGYAVEEEPPRRARSR